MEILDVPLDKLVVHKLNIQYFKGELTDKSALKTDIKANGIKTPIQITSTNEILAGATRFGIAKELGFKKIPAMVIESVKTEEQAKDWIIKDNLLRRHLTTSDRLLLLAELSDNYVAKRGGDRGNQYTGGKLQKLENGTDMESGLKATAKVAGTSVQQVSIARAYREKIRKNPELIEAPVSEVLKNNKQLIDDLKPTKPVEKELKMKYNKGEDSLRIYQAEGEGVSQSLGDFIVSFDKHNFVVGITINHFKKLRAVVKDT